MEKLKLFANFFIGLSLFSLAAAVLLFTRELTIIRTELPEMLQSVDKTAEKIEPALESLGDIKDLIPPILEEVKKTRELVPDILNEVSATRETVPLIIDEISATRSAIPPILEESVKIREAVPGILKTVDKTANAIEGTVKEVEAIRPLIPEVISEIEATRKAIDPALTRADQLITKAGKAGKDATEGAISGVVTGVLKAPFSLFSGFGNSKTDRQLSGTTDFSETDFSIAKKALYKVISKSVGSTQKWNNPKTGMSGTITVTKSYRSAGNQCRMIKNHAIKNGKTLANKLFGLCKDEQMNWKLDK